MSQMALPGPRRLGKASVVLGAFLGLRRAMAITTFQSAVDFVLVVLQNPALPS